VTKLNVKNCQSLCWHYIMEIIHNEHIYWEDLSCTISGCIIKLIKWKCTEWWNKTHQWQKHWRS